MCLSSNSLGHADVQAALAGQVSAQRLLMAELEPVVRLRVARTLYRHRGRSQRRALLQEAEDLSQEVFVELLRNEGRVLRSWDPARGLSLFGFVRMITDRTVSAILTSGVRTPWREQPVDPNDLCDLPLSQAPVDERLISSDLMARVREALASELTPLGFRVFEVLFVEGADVATASCTLHMSAQSVYSWRNRLASALRRLADDLTLERLAGSGQAARC